MKVDLQALKESVERELLKLEKRRAELQEKKQQIEAVQRLVHEAGVSTEGPEAPAKEPEPAVPDEAANKKWFNRTGT